MIPVNQFLACVHENAERIHAYELGHDGSDGKSDCIGEIIGALRLAGFRWPGVHGSNWAARNAMATLGHIANVREMFPGEIVYKAKEPGENGYELPDRYRDSGDLRDYYHVGVVTSIDPLDITHCTSRNGVGGVYVDTTLGAWRWGGKLKYVDYDEQEEGTSMEIPYQAIAAAASGNTVNLRAKPDKKSTLIGRVNIGETVTVLDEMDGWAKVSYHGKTGYMMDQYLAPIPDVGDEDQDEDTVDVPRDMLETWADVMEEMARDIREKLGKG